MGSLGPVHGVIFDLDGVLVHSGEAHETAFKEALKPFGINDFQYAQYAGRRTRDVVEDVFKEHGIDASAEQISEASSRKSQLARDLLEAKRPADPASGIVLAELAARFHLGLASSGSRSSVQGFLNWTGSRSLFRSVFSSEDVQRAKPDPEIYLQSAERLGLKPAECLVVEDAVSGVTAARRMGATVVGVAGTVAEERLREAGADCVISSLGDLPKLLPEQSPIDRSQWTAVIPAAGRGSRLGFHRPKILYPVAGRMILEWMLDFLVPNYGRLVFVLSPDGASDVEGELEKLIPGRYEIAIQVTRKGMGDAVQVALPRVRTDHVTVVWEDQVTLQRESVEICQRLHQGPLHADLTCPTVLRARPYIHFERDELGNICGLRQAREGDAMPAQGESDTGFFCFKTSALERMLPRMRVSENGAGKGTGEFNLLPIIPVMARSGVVLTPRVMRLEETMGINSAPDADAVADFLRRGHGRTN
jgi:HAD superfamily hydrolase (TIGR01509 family)